MFMLFQNRILKVPISQVISSPTKMKTIFFTVLLFVVAAAGAYSQTCHMRIIEDCMEPAISHYESHGVPPNEEELQQWCDIIAEVEDCKGNYSVKCFSPMQREVIGLLSGGKTDALTICDKGSEFRTRYLSYAECLADATLTDEFKSNVKDIQVMIEKVSEVPFKQRMPLLCCGFKRFSLNLDEVARQRCGEGAVFVLRELVKIITADMPDFLCRRFDPENDQCQSVLPAHGTKPSGKESAILNYIKGILGED